MSVSHLSRERARTNRKAIRHASTGITEARPGGCSCPEGTSWWPPPGSEERGPALLLLLAEAGGQQQLSCFPQQQWESGQVGAICRVGIIQNYYYYLKLFKTCMPPPPGLTAIPVPLLEHASTAR